MAPGGYQRGGPVDRAHESGARVFELAPGVVERVADTVHPQPVLAVVALELVPLDALPPAAGADLVVVCAEVRDPGNAGTVIRTAEASGASAVVVAADTVDPTNPKTVRASAGSLFHLPVVEGGPALDVLAALRARGYTIAASVPRGGTDYGAVDFRRPVALFLGNEAAGLAPEVLAAADLAVTVPVAGRAESLNVSAAAAVICFEARRQRAATGSEAPAAPAPVAAAADASPPPPPSPSPSKSASPGTGSAEASPAAPTIPRMAAAGGAAGGDG